MAWTASGEDGSTGLASSYSIRYLRDEAIRTEADWERAHTLEVRPTANAGAESIENARLEGINPETSYGIAVRAFDEAGQISAFVPGIMILEYDTPLPTPPLAIDALGLETSATRSAQIRFRHPHVPEGGAPLAYYVIGIATQAVTEANWDRVGKFDSAPEPSSAGTMSLWTLTPLQPGTQYHVAVRARDTAGSWSPISSDLEFMTKYENLAPPDPPGSVHAAWDDERTLTVSWSAPVDPRVSAFRVYREGVEPGWHAIADVPVGTTTHTVDDPDPQQMQRFAVTSLLGDGTESGLSASGTIFVDTWEVHGPFPHPIRESCRIEVDVPWDAGASVTLSAEIFSVTGKRIRTLDEQIVTGGQTAEWTWDRKDHRGKRVGPGYYFLRITGGGRDSQQTIYVAP
ncbi:MAG: fibronectin type III domain-containing protein [Candidatus Eisenbacteria bacterium]